MKIKLARKKVRFNEADLLWCHMASFRHYAGFLIGAIFNYINKDVRYLSIVYVSLQITRVTNGSTDLIEFRGLKQKGRRWFLGSEENKETDDGSPL